MGSMAELIARTAGPSVWIAEQMLRDVRPDQFARKPRLDGKVVDTNHPAFVYGHLALYGASALETLGLDPRGSAVPPAYKELFSGGKVCQDDPDGTIYPPMQEITAHFFASHRAVLEQLPSVSDEALLRPNPAEGRLKEMFPTVGGLVNFLLASHIMLHMGQVSAWRRCFGLGPVM